MSVRSGVFIKYVVAFSDAAGKALFKVSNDALAGDVCIDADVSISMSRGIAGTTFTVTLYDLPEKMVKMLADPLPETEDDPPSSAPQPAKAQPPMPTLSVKLGYFDANVAQVLVGVYNSLESSTEGDQLVTRIKGRESAFFACSTTKFTQCFTTDIPYADVANQILAGAKFSPGQIATSVQTDGSLPSDVLHNPTFRSDKVLGILEEIAERANAELLIADGKVFMGSPIRNDSVPPATLDHSVNLATFQPFIREIPDTDKLNFPNPVPAVKITGFRFTVVGDPTMRPGQQVSVQNVKGYDSGANPEFRIRQIEHSYSSSAGYTCSGVATIRLKDGAQARQIDSAAERSAASVARDVAGQIRKQSFDNPYVEVVAVKAAVGPYEADLFYGQPATGGETQASVNVPVTADADHVYAAKPIASPFAWYKCGLVTPVYPGMKALLLHNRAVTSDGIVAGYIWSKEPAFTPPPNQAGDWWLCLPIDFDTTQTPTDYTNAVNDLTTNTGCRVIEMKGLKITVGAKGLNKLGTRPTPGDPETCTIAHASGAMITIKNGEIDVDTGAGPKLSMSSSGIVITDGKLNMQIANGKLAIS